MLIQILYFGEKLSNILIPFKKIIWYRVKTYRQILKTNARLKLLIKRILQNYLRKPLQTNVYKAKFFLLFSSPPKVYIEENVNNEEEKYFLRICTVNNDWNFLISLTITLQQFLIKSLSTFLMFFFLNLILGKSFTSPIFVRPFHSHSKLLQFERPLWLPQN